MIQRGIRDDYIIFVGGAPMNAEYGKAFGADAYCIDAGVGVATANAMVNDWNDQTKAS